MLVIWVLLLSGCCAPMKCSSAKIGFTLYEPIILALEKYKTDYKEYPDTLNNIVPNYLAKIPNSSNPPWPSDVEYNKEKENFLLIFKYSGPGKNVCEYKSIEKRWVCFGYY